MRKVAEIFWPIIGLVAVIASFYLLYHEFQGESVGAEVWAALKAIPPSHYFFAACSTLLAYAALAWYDQIALLHLGVRHISWVFISMCSFTTYALSHNIGASVFSGAALGEPRWAMMRGIWIKEKKSPRQQTAGGAFPLSWPGPGRPRDRRRWLGPRASWTASPCRGRRSR